MRADEALPDHLNEAVFDGVAVRKGTVAAFIASACTWLDAAAPLDARRSAERDIVDCAPALRTIGLFEVLQIRDDRLRSLVDGAAAGTDSKGQR